MLAPPIAHVEAIDRAELNRLLVAWGHRMGPYERPTFAFEAFHALFRNGAPVAVTAAGETVRETIGDTGLRRDQVVELVRLCAGDSYLNRLMLRLWRQFVLPDLCRAHSRSFAVSYQDEALHRGDTYRFDGWVRIGRGGGGGMDARSGRKGRSMSIWAWPPDAANVLRSGC